MLYVLHECTCLVSIKQVILGGQDLAVLRVLLSRRLQVL